MKTFKKILPLLIMVFAITLVSAQDKTEVRNVTGFSGIDVREGIKLELTYGDKEYVEVTADEEYIDRVVTEVSGSTLEVYIKGNNWNSWHKEILVKVTAKKVESIDVSSGASLITQNLIESETLKMNVSSGASMKVAFKAPNASCKSTSGATARLKGVAKYFDVEANSGASLHASEVKAFKVKAEASSGANVSVEVEDDFTADASSGGSIKYSGSPKTVDIEKSSGGSVHKD